MKFAAALPVLFAAVLVAFLPALPAGAKAVERATIDGRSYLRLRDWALARGMETQWLVRDKTLQLSGGPARITVTLDSAEIQFNGIRLFLSHAVARRNGGFFVSDLDAETILQPLVEPPRRPAWKPVKTICLDPGHGAKDPGNQEGSRQEKKLVLQLARELQTQLTKLGFKVVLTRKRDSFVDLDERAAIARKAGADLFLSLHFNSSPSSKSTVRGVETYCLTPAKASSTNARGVGATSRNYRGNQNDGENLWLACQIQKSLVAALKTNDRGVRRARFAVLRDAAMPAVLIEGGFMSHPVEGKKLLDGDYLGQMARAIADGVVAYKKTVERAN